MSATFGLEAPVSGCSAGEASVRRIEGVAGKVALTVVFALLAFAAPAYATFPGENGKIAFGWCGPIDCGISR